MIAAFFLLLLRCDFSLAWIGRVRLGQRTVKYALTSAQSIRASGQPGRTPQRSRYPIRESQIQLHVRAPAGTRIETTEKILTAPSSRRADALGTS